MDLLIVLFLAVLTIILIMISHLLFNIHNLISVISSSKENIIAPASPKIIKKRNHKRIYKENIIVPTSPKVIREKNSKKI